MIKRLLIVSCLLIIGIAAKADEPKIDSKVQKVIIFLNGAQVTRTASVNITAGASTLVFGNISPNIDVQSLQVRANGDFTILSVKSELNFLNEQVRRKNVDDLQAQQKTLRDKITFQNTLLTIDQQEEQMLTKNQLVSGQNANLDILKLRQALDFQTMRLTEIKKRETVAHEQIATLNIELQKLNRQIADVMKGSSKATSNIIVTVSSKTPLQSTFTLSYVVNNASWYPTYDIRAKNVNSPITIAYKANVSQQSGEDWKNIKLTLSTGNPSLSGSKQTLNPYYLNFGMSYTTISAITKVSGRVYDNNGSIPGVIVKVKGTSIGSTSDANGNYSIQIPQGASQLLVYAFIGYETIEQPVTKSVMNVGLRPTVNSLNEVVAVGYGTSVTEELSDRVAGLNTSTLPVAVQQTQNQTNVEFNIDNPYSIPSDGKQYLVEINQVELAATYQYYTAPKINTDVFLTASLTDWNKYNFLSGEANLFFEGTYIGKSLINTQVATDTLNLSLGTDKNIVVTRVLQKELTEKQTFTSNKKDTRSWLIDIKNRKNQPVSLLVEDQVPVSQNSSIEVENQEVSAGNLDKATGKVSWNLNLNPQDEKKLLLKYQVRYPRNQSIIVQ
ncbi:mucoidy inhibitor MuiA family protein [Mucilaginibacter sp.]|uniref:mucoidy inhibitor MuiA family protein n=1 Tax=Mucilaginibacter sp. TaxID=1882438 RepID=UPI00261A44E3|nr:mucoidy inhibitor MuiA family protein [Mucilaginibacter sp.]MDB4926206.1 hypothetical protein [Mucilaginibacter sp.]